MKSFLRLFKDCFSKESFTGKAEKDEMVLYERNKISYVGMTVLTCLITLFGFFADSLELRGVSQYISAIVGIVNYGMLIVFCNKIILKHSMACISFIWSIFTLPMAIVNLFLDKIIRGEIFLIIQPIAIVLIVIVMYAVADVIYIRALKKSDCD
ncbi:MAG: hypothetical protein IKJ59_08490 [Clostridia bacterium]|nr:hypothetical protein [Clostridia bacterium]